MGIINTPTNQNNEKRHLLSKSTPNLPPSLNSKTPIKSKSVQEFEELEAHYNTSLVESLKEHIDTLQSEVYFLRDKLRGKKYDIDEMKNI